jgi:hypothetical protein
MMGEGRVLIEVGRKWGMLDRFFEFQGGSC